MQVGDCIIYSSGISLGVNDCLELSLRVVYKGGCSINGSGFSGINSSLKLSLECSIRSNVIVFYGFKSCNRITERGKSIVYSSCISLGVDRSLKLGFCVINKIFGDNDGLCSCSCNSSLKFSLESSVCGNIVVFYIFKNGNRITECGKRIVHCSRISLGVDGGLKLSLCVVYKGGSSVNSSSLSGSNSSLKLSLECSICGNIVVFYIFKNGNRITERSKRIVHRSSIRLGVDGSLKLGLCVVHKGGSSVNSSSLSRSNGSLKLSLQGSICCNVVVFYSFKICNCITERSKRIIHGSGICLGVDGSLQLSLRAVYKSSCHINSRGSRRLDGGFQSCFQGGICTYVIVFCVFKGRNSRLQAFDCRVHSRSICFACERSFKCCNRAVHVIYCIVKLF